MSVDLNSYDPAVREFFSLSWTIEVRPYEDGTHFARIVELPGCMTEADSRSEVLEHLDDALAEWLAVALENGQEIPSPRGAIDYSGKIFVRTSPALHAAVAACAGDVNVSMSQWVGELLAREVGFQESARVETKLVRELARLRRVVERSLAREQVLKDQQLLMTRIFDRYIGAGREHLEFRSDPAEQDVWKTQRRQGLKVVRSA